ncbi:tetratricopeptide repeat protein [Desulfovibrio psychrotolerans]|uniref:SPOR domain-containing protein n=1 Tax=Desulfovibrio psychrotolerans TaxID=415242 RepID=A0A7J0BVG8_9BACT|nr:tetratricopeptide repeat protein [Desulfovibrio psychrotolerans]GFM36994.1 hypothetical protein DSM19430T_16780 [Desulfovibrio psychrotolerans]
MKRITIIALIALTAALAGGCTATGKDKAASMSLMERFHSGHSLIGEDKELTGKQEDRNLTKEQAEARQCLMRGLSYAAQGRQELAFEQYSRAAALDPGLTQARFRRGMVLLEKQLPAPALEEFTAVMEQNPDYAPGFAAAGKVYFMNGLYPEARKLFEKALVLDASLLEAYDHLGAIHNYNKEYQNALATFRNALEKHPDAVYLFNNVGLAHSMLGQDAEAVEAFRKAIMLGAPSSKAYNNMGLALCRMGRYREALEAFRAAGGEAAAWNNLGYFFFLDGQYPRAITSFEKAIELEPTYYQRAAENLKRARLAAQFAQGTESAPARYGTADPHGDVLGPRTPGVVAPSHGTLPDMGGEQDFTPVPAVYSPVSSAVQPVHAFALQPPVQTAAYTSVRTARQPEPTRAESAADSATATAASPLREKDLPDTTGPNTRSGQVSHNDQVATQATGNAESPATPAAASGNAAYTLHVSSFRQHDIAEQQAHLLREHGADARVLSVSLPDKGNWHRVVTGRYATLEEARRALAEHVEQNGNKETGVRIVRDAATANPAPRNSRALEDNTVPAHPGTGITALHVSTSFAHQP